MLNELVRDRFPLSSSLVNCKHWYLSRAPSRSLAIKKMGLDKPKFILITLKMNINTCKRSKWLGVRPYMTGNVCVAKSVARFLYFNSFFQFDFLATTSARLTKVLVVRETPLHSSSVDLGNVSYCYAENSAKKLQGSLQENIFLA